MRDFPLNTIGGATAAITQKRMWNCLEKMEIKRIRALSKIMAQNE